MVLGVWTLGKSWLGGLCLFHMVLAGAAEAVRPTSKTASSLTYLRLQVLLEFSLSTWHFILQGLSR